MKFRTTIISLLIVNCIIIGILMLIFGIIGFVFRHIIGSVIGAIIGFLLGEKHIGIKFFTKKKKKHTKEK